MLPPMSRSSILLLVSLTTRVYALSLIDALVANGATQFAQELQADPSILAIATSPSGQTIFAPIDGSARAQNVALVSRQVRPDVLFNIHDRQNTIRDQDPPGEVYESRRPAPKLNGENQRVVLQTSDDETDTNAKLRRRWGNERHSYKHPEWRSESHHVSYSHSSTLYSLTESTHALSSTSCLPIHSSPQSLPGLNSSGLTTTEPYSSTPSSFTQSPHTLSSSLSIPYHPPQSLPSSSSSRLATTETVGRVTLAEHGSYLQPTTSHLLTQSPHTLSFSSSMAFDSLQSSTSYSLAQSPPAPSSSSTSLDAPLLSLPSSESLHLVTTETIDSVTILASSVGTINVYSVPEVASSSSANPPSPSATDAGNISGFVPDIPLTVASGLGNTVDVLRVDIPFDQGLIHLVSGYFTVPVLVSETLRATNLTGFGDLLTQTNLSSSIDARSSITIFAPSNAAFAARNASSQTSTGPLSLASAHVIPNFVGYLPVLQDGATHRTLAGDVVTVRMVNGSYFINDARIIETNIITDNGVIHVIDEVLTPGIVYSTSDARPLKQDGALTTALCTIFFVLLGLALT